MSDTTARLGLPMIAPSQAQKHVTHNEALRLLDGITQLVLAGVDGGAPPESPGPGEIHAVGPAPMGAWAGQAGRLARWEGTAWAFLLPQEGWRAWDAGGARVLVFRSGAWVAPKLDLQNVAGVGINAAHDAANPLSVSGEATLLSHAGTDHRLKLNKAGTGDTASLLFQTGFSGRAEMGLAGRDDFAIKVSPDGAGWTEALRIDAATGLLSGKAVQEGPTDTAARRLMAVGAFGLGGAGVSMLPGNALVDGAPSGFYTTDGATSGTGEVPALNGTVMVVARGSGSASPGGWNLWCRGAENQLLFRSYAGGTATDWQPLYLPSNIIGTVSQSTGTPTGAIIERGTNANGDYVRFADGTQICRLRNVDTVSIAKGAALDATWIYPAPFASGLEVALAVMPERASAANGTVPAICCATYRDAMTATQASFGMTNLNTTSAFRYTLSAHGRWFQGA